MTKKLAIILSLTALLLLGIVGIKFSGIGQREDGVLGTAEAAGTFTSAPGLFFSDLTDGPTSGWEGSVAKGAAVSIWGKNFGTSRGTSTVTVCGVTLNNDSDFAEWGVINQPGP